MTVTRTGRVANRLPKRYRDVQPAAPVPVQQTPSTPKPIIRRVVLHVRDLMRTVANAFGLIREYHHRPSYDPDEYVTAEDLANFNTGHSSVASTSGVASYNTHPPPPWPFENMTKFLLMNWANSGSIQKTEAEITRLGREVISSPDFKVEELGSFDAHRENQRMDKAISSAESNAPFSRDGWREVRVDIQIPVASRTKPPPPSRTFSIPGLHHRSLVEVIKAAWSEDMARRFHLSPFKRIHIDPKTKVETRVYDEAYTGDAWIEAHDDLQKQPNEPGCQLEKVIAGLMFWSDSTHVTSFGTAKVWPLYLYFANLSKYIRAQPTSGACHHVAYIPSVQFWGSVFLCCSYFL
jgi:Plavaka transposase